MKRSFRWFVTSLGLLPITVGVLYFGLMMTGGGHGTYGLWYLGLLLSLFLWFSCGMCCITGIRAQVKEKTVVWWVIPSAMLFLLLTGIGIWGLGG